MYEYLIGGELPKEDQMKAIAAKLRGADDRSILAMLSGDPVLSGIGATTMADTQNKASGLQKARQQISERKRMEEAQSENMSERKAQREMMAQYYKDMLEMRREQNEATMGLRREMQEQKVERATLSQENKINDETRKLATQLQNEGVVDLEAAMQELDNKYVDLRSGKVNKNIPGVGGLKNVFPAVGEDAKTMRNNIAAVRNIILKARSGAAVTDPEMKRLAEELALAWNMGDQDLVYAYQNLRRRTETVKTNILSGYNQDVVDRYSGRLEREIPLTSDKTSKGRNYEVVPE